jgi:hypothetical protein
MKWTGERIKKELIFWLNDKYPDKKIIVPEISQNYNGINRIVDVLLVNGHIIGFEIKGETDNLSRLKSQLEIYSKTMEYVYVVYWRDKYKNIEVPKNIGLIEVFEDNGQIQFKIKKKAYYNKIETFTIFQNLWNEEIRFVLHQLGILKWNSKNYAYADMKKYFKDVKITKLKKLYKFILKKRFEKFYENIIKTKEIKKRGLNYDLYIKELKTIKNLQLI